MILVDTSVWVDYLRTGDAMLAELLEASEVSTHPFVIGELACGNLRDRATVLALLSNLPRAAPAADAEVLLFIERHQLMGRGIGYVDAHLLAAAMLTAGTALWTHDRRLHEAAANLGLGSTRA